MNEINFDDWWADLNYEQKRAAFVLWTKSDIKSIYANLNTTDTLTIDNTIHIDKSMSEDEFQKWLRDHFDKSLGGSSRFA